MNIASLFHRIRALLPGVLSKQSQPYRPDFTSAGFEENLDRMGAGAGTLRSRSEHAVNVLYSRFFCGLPQLTSMLEQVERDCEDWRTDVGRAAKAFAQGGAVGFDCLSRDAPPGDKRSIAAMDAENDVLFDLKAHRMSALPQLVLAIRYGELEPSCLLECLQEWAGSPNEATVRAAYFSSLVVAQRFFSSLWALCMLCGDESDVLTDLRSLLLQLIFADVGYLIPRLGDSYPNNHLLVDYFSGWLISGVLPELMTQQDIGPDYESLWVGELMVRHSLTAADLSNPFTITNLAAKWEPPTCC